jgi:muramoyltetrapeptide carboxypeptidase
MIEPYPLLPGDKIGLIAPSRKVTQNDLQECVQLLDEWGYKVVFGENLYQEHHQFAGSDDERAEDFLQMIKNPEIKAILCVRGGYGTVRILEKLDLSVIQQNPKWVIGYSDITVLHSYYNKVVGCETIHASMPINCKSETRQNETWQMLRKVLKGDLIDYEIPGQGLSKPGKTTARLVGGNLSVLFSLRGTFCDLDTDGKILFIEDLDEYLYHLDRMMMNLKISGKLKKLKGLIIGGMTEMKDNTIPFGKTAFEIIADAVNEYDYPVIYNFPAGHCEPNLPLLLGRTVLMDVTQEKAKLEFFDRNS